MEIYITIVVGILAGLFGIALQRPKVFNQMATPIFFASIAAFFISIFLDIRHTIAVSAILSEIADKMDGKEAIEAMKIVSSVKIILPYNTIVATAVVILFWSFFCSWIAQISQNESDSKQEE